MIDWFNKVDATWLRTNIVYFVCVSSIDLETYIKKNPTRLLADLEKRLASSNGAVLPEASGEPALEFTKFNDD